MKNLNTKAHVHARELLKFAEEHEWMQFVLNTNTMGGYKLQNCWAEKGHYNGVPGLYILQIFLKGEWYTLYVGESHGCSYETKRYCGFSNTSPLLSNRFNRFIKTLKNKIGGKDGLHTAGKFMLKHKLAHFTHIDENQMLLQNIRLAVFPEIDLDSLDRMEECWDYPRCKDGTWDLRCKRFKSERRRTRKELYLELESAFIDILQPLCNKQGDTSYSAANGLFVISDGIWSEDLFSTHVEPQRKKKKSRGVYRLPVITNGSVKLIDSDQYTNLPANVCVEGEWINLSTVIR